MLSNNVVTHTDLPFKIFKKGKVRDVYEINSNQLLLIATDRISAFDHVLPDPIPGKGICLTQLSKFWFQYTENIVPNHLITAEVDNYPRGIKKHSNIVAYRSMLVKKTHAIPIECVVRGYISGSAWKSYKKNGTVCGIKLPDGMKESERLDDPIFTPSTKAEKGHDINISFDEMKKLVGRDTAEQLKEISLKIYEIASEYTLKRGIIIADTKFEFGWTDDGIVLIDELLTPDSSRFWPADCYEPGRSQPSFDKQFVRDYLEDIAWDKNSAPPRLPNEIIKETQRKYQEAYERITGEKMFF